jgi:dethiobiotin synthetase
LSEEDYNIDLARDLGLPLVIVAANELGTINATLQTLITARSAAPDLPIAGIVVNQTRAELDDSAATNAAELAKRCDVPLLETIKHQSHELANWKLIAASLSRRAGTGDA